MLPIDFHRDEVFHADVKKTSIYKGFLWNCVCDLLQNIAKKLKANTVLKDSI